MNGSAIHKCRCRNTHCAAWWVDADVQIADIFTCNVGNDATDWQGETLNNHAATG